MQRVFSGFLALLVVWGTVCPRAGQDSTRAVPLPPSQRFSPAELVREFDREVSEGYELGAGDEVIVEVWDRPELTRQYVIGPDGMVTLPVVGPMKLADLSREEAVEKVRSAFEKYYLDPSVTLEVKGYRSNQVMVLGRVTRPGGIEFQTPPTLLEAITMAGGLPVGGMGAEKAALSRCAVFRGRDRVVWIELRKVLTGEDLTLNIRLRNRDVVYLPDADDQLVYVMGEVHQPGAFRLTPDMSPLDALATAGGPNQDAADKIILVQAGQGITREIKVKDLLREASLGEYALQEGDTVYVPKRGLAKVGYVLQKLSPFSGFLLFGTTVTK